VVVRQEKLKKFPGRIPCHFFLNLFNHFLKEGSDTFT